VSDSMKGLEMETRRIGAGWKRKSKKSGKPYISMVLDRDLSSDDKLLLFPNGYKNKENSPDFIMYLQDKDRQQGNTSPSPQASTSNAEAETENAMEEMLS